ncbi:RNA polymerase sigma-70 factor (ECF subfamily) [Scopulibacillus darangshiensis]|uniref:RNA polymerase sigma-70 factor (ECF subfamily) n=1 Tax=Scopulibacillus darangshiensis TaxID=442528 RepID=A0A4R2P2I5_9BACL|nr:RNA polymerase sigma factor [Scopulibacillus darangshiensis]TCP28842.1 RNA polymerase sigma-70 factor (ECF subfamily) [Scopulibacillus darangshiensis]
MLVEDLYEKHNKELERFARSMASNEKEAEDLLQDTFLKALTHLHSLSRLTDYQQRAWLFKVLRNLRYDRFRKQRFEVPIREQDEPESEQDGYSVVEMEELLQILPSDLRDVVYKRYWLGLTSKQIAGPLGLSDATIRYRLQTAIRLLRNKINK